MGDPSVETDGALNAESAGEIGPPDGAGVIGAPNALPGRTPGVGAWNALPGGLGNALFSFPLLLDLVLPPPSLLPLVFALLSLLYGS